MAHHFCSTRSELDFNKNVVDIHKLKYYLSRRIMEIHLLERGAPINLESLTSQSPDPKGFERLFQWLGGDQRELDPNELDVEFHNNIKILLDDEKCMMVSLSSSSVIWEATACFVSIALTNLSSSLIFFCRRSKQDVT